MLVYDPKNVVSPRGSSEKICHVMHAKSTDFILKNYNRVSKNVPENYPFDINGKAINLKQLIIKAFQRGRPTAVAVIAFAVGTHMEAYPEASSTCGENPTPLLEKLRRCRSRLVLICHQQRTATISPWEQTHSQAKEYRQMLGKLRLATEIGLSQDIKRETHSTWNTPYRIIACAVLPNKRAMKTRIEDDSPLVTVARFLNSYNDVTAFTCYCIKTCFLFKSHHHDLQ